MRVKEEGKKTMRAKDTRNIGGEKDNKNKRREKSKKTKEWKTQWALFVPSVGVLKIKIKGGGGCQRQ